MGSIPILSIIEAIIVPLIAVLIFFKLLHIVIKDAVKRALLEIEKNNKK